MKAIWNGVVIAESDATRKVEANHYFPLDAVNTEYLKQSDYHTTCPWKGEASYYHVVAGGETNENAAWFYPDPSEKASEIKDYVAFWRGVKVTE
ncbi:MAG: DUF427 domain-containing protein [Rhodothermales bacterium]